MSLKAFHVLFISAAVALALGMAAWCLKSSLVGAAVGSVVVAIGLIAYEVWFLKKARRLP